MRKLIISVLLVIVTGLKAQNRDSLKIIASNYDKKGGELAMKGDLAGSLENLNRALKIHKRLNDKGNACSTLNGIAQLFIEQGDFSKALDYFNENLETQRSIGDKKGIGESLFLISKAYMRAKDLPRSLHYAKEAIKIQREIGDKEYEAHTLNIVAIINNKDAIENYTKCLEIFTQLDNKVGITQSLRNIGYAYYEQKKYQKALEYSLQSLNLSKEQCNAWGIKTAAKTLKEIYQKQNKPAQALEMYELYTKMRDSINNDQTRKAVIQKQYQIEYEKKALTDSLKANEEKQINTLKIEAQSIQIRQGRTQKIALFGGLGLVIIFAGIMFNRFKVIQKQKAIIEHSRNETLASIRYAKRIQTSLITSEVYIEKALNRLQNN
jgi:tetratricopeptide (TPR) repeat protein